MPPGVSASGLSIRPSLILRRHGNRRPKLSAALQERRQELQAKEYSEQWQREYARVEAESCALAAELREVYPAVQSKLVDLLTRIKACDANVGRINGSAHAGQRSGFDQARQSP
jgi:hypothetical protein